MRYRLVATAGHVDHGKTALLEALTGHNADRLEEEQQRGLTVDLGFADLQADDLHVGFVDVPGHQDFIKNMVSGVGSVQGVLFVVSAVDGWQEQSREHFEIVNLLEPDYCCFAVTKCDLADEDMQLVVRAEVEQAIEDTRYTDAPCLTVSAETGEGVKTLERQLIDDLAETPDPPDHGKPYCPVDRVFSVQGQGTVVTGSLSDGQIEEDDELVRMPAGQSGRVRSIQQYHRAVSSTHPGSRVALNVPEWERDTTKRGDVATVAAAGRVDGTLDGRLKTPRFLHHPLEHDTQVLVYLGTGRYPAKILLAGSEHLRADERRLARVRLLDGEVFSRPGDHVLVRSFNDRRLLGRLHVGAVGSEGRLGDAEYRRWLANRFPPTPRTLLKSHLDRDGYVRTAEAAHGTRYGEASFREAADELGDETRTEAEWAVDPDWWEQRLGTLEESVLSYHEEYPLRPGLPLTHLHEIVREEGLREPVIRALRDRDIEAYDEYLRVSGFEPELPPEERDRVKAVLDQLDEAGLETPERNELEERLETEQIDYLVRDGELVEIAEDRLVTRSVLNELKNSLREFIDTHEPVRLSEIRDHLDSSRKYVVPLMEFLDRQGLTYRDGDVRYLRRDGEG